MLGEYHITPRSQAALAAVTKHGSVMAVDRQKGGEVLLYCATSTCPCWATHRWRQWMRLNLDVVLGSSVTAAQSELDQSQSVASP